MQKKLLKDVNGVEMRTGDIVEITGGYYKHDNGLYFVRHSPGDVSWRGSDYSLRRICKNGKLSKAINNINFWPIFVSTNSEYERMKAKEHNEKYAKIEIRKGIEKTYIIEHLQIEVDDYKKSLEMLESMYSSEYPESKRVASRIDFLEDVIARLKTE